MKNFLCFLFGHYYKENGHFMLPLGETKDVDELGRDFTGRPVDTYFYCERCKRKIVEYQRSSNIYP